MKDSSYYLLITKLKKDVSKKVTFKNFIITLFSVSIIFIVLLKFDDINGAIPEENMSTIQIIEYYRYPAETIRVKSDDGYILEMHRIPYGKVSSNNNTKTPRPAIFLQHGLLASSSDWVVNEPSQSPAFVFADAGFDVWMGNMRGNVYSRQHEKYSTFSRKFWRFSWDEMAKYDLDAMINYILDVTGQESLYYIGHSQGTITMFSKLSEDKIFQKKVKKMFALAPVAQVGHIKGLMYTISELFHSSINLFEKYFGSMEFLPSTWYIRMASRLFCGSKLTNPLCQNVMFLIGGPESNQLNTTRLPVYLSHTPAGTSTDNIAHWAQMVISKKVQKFDFGSPDKNLLHYNQTTPPYYDFSKIFNDIYLYWSDSDWLADEIDVQEGLLHVLPNIKLNKHLIDFNHFDFIYGLRARKEIYDDIIEIIKS
uniref:Lipase n=2 Tax=Strongyloides stercoralis TaxID=6248 RepID=A0A0K0EJA2_STRER